MSSRVIYSRRIVRKIGDNHPVGARTFSAREHEKHALQTPRAGAIILADMFKANMQLEYKKTWTSMPSNEATAASADSTTCFVRRWHSYPSFAFVVLTESKAFSNLHLSVFPCLRFFLCGAHGARGVLVASVMSKSHTTTMGSKVRPGPMLESLLQVDVQKVVAPLTYPENFGRLQPMR